MKFLNLTPHTVTLANGTLTIKFEKDITTPVARVEQIIEEKMISYEVIPGMVIDMPVNVVTRTNVYGLPEPQEGVIYICSSMVATHVRRPDVIAPITDSTCVRDENGRVISVKGFQTFNHDYKFPKVEEPVVVTPLVREMAQEMTAAALDVIEPSEEGLEEMDVVEKLIGKIDYDMLDPIKLAAKEKERQKYLKRIGKRY